MTRPRRPPRPRPGVLPALLVLLLLGLMLTVTCTAPNTMAEGSAGPPSAAAAAESIKTTLSHKNLQSGADDYESGLAILADLDAKLPAMRFYGYRRILLLLPPDYKFDAAADGDMSYHKDTDHVPTDTDGLFLSAWRSLRRYLSSADTVIGTFFGALRAELEITAKLASSQPPTTQEQLLNYVQSVARARRLLYRAWTDFSHPQAVRVLGEIAFYGNYSSPIRPKVAFEFFRAAAAASGDPDAHFHLAMFYSGNIGHVLAPFPATAINSTRQGSALLHLHMAASANHTSAEMALGYRYFAGISVEQSCTHSASYYYRVAKKVLDVYLSGPPGGRLLPAMGVRLYLDADSGGTGGIYGPGGQPALPRGTRQRSDPDVVGPLSEEDTFEYYKYLADNGDLQAQYVLGVSFYWGTHTVPRHYGRAMRYLSLAANNLNWKNGKTDSANLVAHSAAILGRMYLRGEGVPTSNSTAKRWFERASKTGDALGVSYLSIMVLDRADGVAAKPTPPDLPLPAPTVNEIQSALASLKAAAKSGRVEAQSYLGRYYFDRRNIVEAAYYLSHAMTNGDIPSMFLMAENYLHGIGVGRSCAFANQLYRNIAEKGIELISPAASEGYEEAVFNPSLAMLFYLNAAERGSEIAQSNLAWLLSRHTPNLASRGGGFWSATFSVGDKKKKAQEENQLPQSPGLKDSVLVHDVGFLESENRAIVELFPCTFELLTWNRAAQQGNGYARIRVGDFFYYGGLGVSKDYARAAAYYRVASDTDNAPLAMWSLGYMYHHGLGVEQDQHMAKRYYDRSLELNMDAWLPITLSLWHLRFSQLTGRFRAPRYEAETPFRHDKSISNDVDPGAKKTESSGAKLEPSAKEETRAKTPLQGHTADGSVADGASSDGERASPEAADAKGSKAWTWKEVQRQKQGRYGSAKKRRFVAIRKYLEALLGRFGRANVGGGAGAGGAGAGVGTSSGRAAGAQDGGAADGDEVETYLVVLVCLVVAYLVYLRQTRFGRVAGAAAPP